MKKLSLLTFAFFMCFFVAKAQIMNSNFDLWTDNGSYENPDGWTSSNGLSSNFGSGEILISKDSTQYNTGPYSARLETKNVTFNLVFTTQTFPVPGILTNGEINIGQSELITIGSILIGGGSVEFMDYIEGGSPINQRYEKLTGFYSYSPVGADEGAVYVFVEKNNEIIGSGSLDFTTAQPAITPFEVDIEYTECGIPDNLLIVFLSSASESGQPGTVLHVDDLEVTGNNQDNLPPSAPAVTVNTSTNVSVQFNLLSNASGSTYDCGSYDIQVQSTPQPNNGTLTDDGNGSYTYTPNQDFTGQDSFEYTVCEDGNSTNCTVNSITVNVTDPSSVLDRDIDNNLISVYPVPARNQLTFSTVTSDILNGTILISDVTGRLVETTELNGSNTTISVSNFADGVYFFQVVDAHHSTLSSGRFNVSK